ncbi:ribosome small subunit-dependent GTPase A [Veronia nyctiphanis]|uniref:Small ribosomal subunit biogenesis GTPase RsgA n=2 Tax=Veronia nyctiphanis TaxID=1278244 RepID=A0A4Q0YR97_9GAMM|nr:ribosome small subunit-dependent GTPase A [Veronia nyctiphanis]
MTLDQIEHYVPARVIEQHRSELVLATEKGAITLLVRPSTPKATVGDWLLIGQDNQCLLLDRHSLFQRRAVANDGTNQLIAANVDTAFIVCSMNEDFNLNRIERYLALCRQANVQAVVVMSKADLCEQHDDMLASVQRLDAMLPVIPVNGLDTDSVSVLHPWCAEGQTIVLLGSSGVGKSTLVNTLCGANVQLTSGIREDDAKGRHTTTSRSVHLIPAGGLLIDVPGMREIQLSSDDDAVREAFTDIASLVSECRFTDCQHQTEPGCQILKALECGTLDTRRWHNYLKLMREQERANQTVAQQRAKFRTQKKLNKVTNLEINRLKQRE